MAGSLEFDKSIKNGSDTNKVAYTKVKDLLRQSRETAFNLNDQDLDKMFNMQMPDSHSDDKTARDYIKKIIKLRNMQKEILPLYLES